MSTKTDKLHKDGCYGRAVVLEALKCTCVPNIVATGCIFTEVSIVEGTDYIDNYNVKIFNPCFRNSRKRQVVATDVMLVIHGQR